MAKIVYTEPEIRFCAAINQHREIYNGHVRFEFKTPSSVHVHRMRGPASIFSNGTVVYKNANNPHRTDGPAYINADGTKRYFVNGIELTKLDFFVRYGAM